MVYSYKILTEDRIILIGKIFLCVYYFDNCYSLFFNMFYNYSGARVMSFDLTTHTSLSPIWHGFVPSFVNYKKGCTRLASDKFNQLPAQGRWFSPGTLASSTTKTGRHNIAEILLKMALNTKIQI